MTCQTEPLQNPDELVFTNPDETSADCEDINPDYQAVALETCTYYYFFEFADLVAEVMDIKDTAVIKSREAEGEEKMEDVFKELGIE